MTLINSHEKNIRYYPKPPKKKDEEWVAPGSWLHQDPDDIDENDNGGLDHLEPGEDEKYGPGNYPDGVDFNFKLSDHNMVVNHVLGIGPHPLFTMRRPDLSIIRKAGYKAIISVTENHLLDTSGFQYYFKRSHADGPEAQQLLDICRIIDSEGEKLGRPVFVHSLDGLNRAPMVYAAYMLYKGYIGEPDEAIDYVRESHHPKALNRGKQQVDELNKFAMLIT